MTSTCAHCCPPDRFEKIRAAFRQTGGALISSVKDILGDDYSYEESRVVQLYMQQQERISHSGEPAVPGRQSEQSAGALPPTSPAQGATESEEQSDAPAVRRGRRKRAGRIGATHERTRQLWEQGLSVEEIAEKRGLAKSTIVDHLDRLMDEGLEIDLRPLLSPPEKVEAIRRAFEESDGTLLSSVKGLLGDAYDYDEIKMVRLFLKQKGELPE